MAKKDCSDANRGICAPIPEKHLFPYDHPYWDIKFKYIEVETRRAYFDDGTWVRIPDGIVIHSNFVNRKGLMGFKFSVPGYKFQGDFWYDGNECKRFCVQKMTAFQKMLKQKQEFMEDSGHDLLPPEYRYNGSGRFRSY